MLNGTFPLGSSCTAIKIFKGDLQFNESLPDQTQHAQELRKHQGLMRTDALGQLAHQLVQFDRMIFELILLIQNGGRITNLTELHQALQNGQLRFLYALRFDRTQDLVPIIIPIRIIDRTLLLLHLTKQDHLLLFRQVFGHLLFGSTQNEWIQQLPQMFFSIGLAQFIDGNRKLLLEELHRSQHARIQELHLCIHIKRIVLQRRTTHANSMLGLQQARGSGHLAGRILDGL